MVLGLRYQAGLGVTENQEKAYELFRLSADKGNAQAAYYVSATNRFENPGTDTWYWLKKSAKGGYVPGMLQLGKLYEETGDTDEAVRWYTGLAKTEGNDVEHQVAAKRKTAIGKREPSTDINTVKPQLLKLLSSAANNYSGTLRWETEPLDGNKVDVLSTSTYYSTSLETGFKNALIRKEVVQTRDLGNVQVKAGTHWSYSADIVYSVSQETSLRVFEQWITVLKTILPGWKHHRGGTTERPLFSTEGKTSNGKIVVISMSVSGLNSENVGIHVSNRN